MRQGRRPRLLDLFSGAGGAARGYQQAGFHVTGVDSRPQPRYVGDVFVQADALTFPLDGFAAVHASPPCQAYSCCRHMPGRGGAGHPHLVAGVLERLSAWGGLYVVENVSGAGLHAAIILCGQTFGLGVYRHRHFQCNLLMLAPPHEPHRVRLAAGGLNRYFGADAPMVTVAGHQFSLAAGSRAMGIDWMTRDELAEAVPPAYTRWIGERLLAVVAQRSVEGLLP